MRKPRLLDLFCKAGGAGMGYYLAGFEVVGVDIEPQPNYPFEFIQADALTVSLDGFDAFHASPPCQRFSSIFRNGRESVAETYPDLVDPIRQRLRATGKPYVIENVPGAPLVDPIVLCGEMFGLRVIRHRLFESNLALLQPEHRAHRGIVRRNQTDGGYYLQPVGHNTGKREWGAAMGIDWMRTPELAEAIPPVYTEFIGRQLMEYIRGSELSASD